MLIKYTLIEQMVHKVCTTAVRASDLMTPLRKTLTSGLGLDGMAWPAVVQLLVFIYSGIQ